MTLIITALSPHRIVQVSDRRLTLPGGHLADDKAIKAVVVHCDDAYFSVAYTGLAKVRDKRTRQWERTDKWIANSLHGLMQQGIGTAIELYRTFGAYAEETLASTPVQLTRKGTTFVFSGFFLRTQATAFVGILSNMRTTEARSRKVVREFDTQTVWSPRSTMPYNELELFVEGMLPALGAKDPIAKAIHRRAKKMERELESSQRGPGTRDDNAIAIELVQMVRMANGHPQYGKYIGRDCMSVQIRSDTRGMITDTHTDSIERDWPWMVSPDMVLGGWHSMVKEDGTDDSGGS